MIKLLQDKSRAGTVTFVYAVRNEQHSSALVLREFLERTRKG